MYVCMYVCIFILIRMFVCLCVCVLRLGHVPTMQRDTSSHLHSAVWQDGVAMWKHRPRLEEIGYEDVAPEVLQEGPHQVGMRRKCIPQTWSNMFEINTTVVECWQAGGSNWFPVIFHLSICPDMSQTMWNKSRHFSSFSWAFIAPYECILSTEISRNQPFSTEECAALVARHVFHLWHTCGRVTDSHWNRLNHVLICQSVVYFMLTLVHGRFTWSTGTWQ